MHSKGEFRRSILKVVWKIVDFGVFGKGVEHGGLFHKDL